MDMHRHLWSWHYKPVLNPHAASFCSHPWADGDGGYVLTASLPVAIGGG